MKKLLFIFALCLPFVLNAQFGFKAGLNFTNVTNVAGINNKSSSGFNVGLFFATPYTSIIGSKTELVFSRQGYSYETNAMTGKVNLDYVMLPTYMCINITKYFQIQVGMELAYLISAKADSTGQNQATSSASSSVLNYYNRFNYAIGGGIEVHPVKGLLVGARMNVSLNNLYKTSDYSSIGGTPASSPDVNIKANVLQIYAGWKFGK